MSRQPDLVVIEKQAYVLSVGQQGPVGPVGPVGPMGPAGSSEAPTISALNTSGTPLLRGQPVYMKVGGDVAHADAVTNFRVAGLSYQEVSHLAYGLIQTSGQFDATTAEWDAVTNGTGGLVPGGRYFLSVVPGRITLTPDPSAAVAPIGRAVSPTRLSIDIEPPILA